MSFVSDGLFTDEDYLQKKLFTYEVSLRSLFSNEASFSVKFVYRCHWFTQSLFTDARKTYIFRQSFRSYCSNQVFFVVIFISLHCQPFIAFFFPFPTFFLFVFTYLSFSVHFWSSVFFPFNYSYVSSSGALRPPLGPHHHSPSLPLFFFPIDKTTAFSSFFSIGLPSSSTSFTSSLLFFSSSSSSSFSASSSSFPSPCRLCNRQEMSARTL